MASPTQTLTDAEVHALVANKLTDGQLVRAKLTEQNPKDLPELTAIMINEHVRSCRECDSRCDRAITMAGEQIAPEAYS